MFEKPLSPSTQAVSDAIKEEYLLWEALHPGDAERIAAAALRAVANHIQYKDDLGMTAYGGHAQALRQILDIATELEETK